MPIEPAALPSALPAAFSVPQARAAGVSAGRLRAGDLLAPHRGVRVRSADMDRVDESDTLERPSALRRAVLARARAYAHVMHPGAFFVGRTALALYGLPLERLDGERLSGQRLLEGTEDLHVGVFAPQCAPRARGILGMQSTTSLVTVRPLEGLVLASAASTWALLAGVLDERGLIRLGDAIVRVPRDDGGRHVPRAQLATIDQLRAAAAVPQRRRRAMLTTALTHIRVGSGSPLETDWRVDAEAAGLAGFDLDVEIRDDRGRLAGIADAVHRGSRVIVEVEGDHHRTDRRQWARDIEKHAAYDALGWHLVRLTAAHIRSGRAVTLLRTALTRPA